MPQVVEERTELTGVRKAAVFLAADGPGEVPKIGTGERLKGAVLPHIDLERGGSCYAKGWAAAASG